MGSPTNPPLTVTRVAFFMKSTPQLLALNRYPLNLGNLTHALEEQCIIVGKGEGIKWPGAENLEGLR